MTAICIRLSADFAVFAADTLMTTDERGFGFCSKVLAFPHLGLIMASCGSGVVTDDFWRFLQRNFSRDGRQALSGPEALREAYAEHRHPITQLPMPTRVFLAQATGDGIQAAHFGSPDFASEQLQVPARVAVPSVEYDDWANPLAEPVDFARMIAAQKRLNSRQCSIGDEVTVVRLDCNGTITMYPKINAREHEQIH